MVKTSSIFRYRIRNWREYNRALINRGRLTVWFDEQAIIPGGLFTLNAWERQPLGQRPDMV
jgi:hypothetical protein